MTIATDIDEFRLVRTLGKGGMGTVYLGHDTLLDRPVAIKLIEAREPGTAMRERFFTEARAIARLSHPNVVAIYRVGTTADGRPFLAQELIRGKSLDRVERPLPWRRVCELAVGVARGLAAAHRRGILHRDVKPANVMLDDDGVPRLLDFGLAKLASAEAPRGRAIEVRADRDVTVSATAEAPAPIATESPGGARIVNMTAPGDLLGTPRYMAPEIWLGERATPRSDVYSLGVMLYELAVGAVPHPERDLEGLRRAVLDTAATPLGDVAPDVAPALARIVDKCLARDPGDRPVSADELVHDLEQILVDAPAIPEGNPYRGLQAFDAAHRRLFFGRGGDIAAIVDRLRSESLIVVAGHSGVGKSSVCRAGVVPAVLAGGLGGSRRWRVALFSPGRTPLVALAAALGVDAAAPDFVGAIRASLGDDEGVLVVIDQLEELVTQADRAQAARIAEVLAAIGDGTPGLKALVSVRGDYLSSVAELPELGPALGRGVFLLRALTAVELRDAVVGPARIIGFRFETDAMVDTLVAAVAENSAALPLLQFALAELWQARDVERGVIPAAALDALGGVAGALARHADSVLVGLGTTERAAARRILLRLVTAAGTRAVREREDLVGEGERAATALESLVRGRLVVARETTGEPVFELAHEALIDGWSTLRDWLDGAASQRALRERLHTAAREWVRHDRGVDLLWSRRQVEACSGLDDELGNDERAFLRTSERHARRRTIVRGVLLAALPAIALATWAGIRWRNAIAVDRNVAVHVDAAAARKQAGDAAAREATRERNLAFAEFDADRTPSGESHWQNARQAATAARAAYRVAASELEAALQRDGERNDVRHQMAEILYAHAEVAEAISDRESVTDLIARVEALDRDHAAQWRAPAHLTLDVNRPSTIVVRRYDRAGNRLVPAAPLHSARDHLDVELAPGSYLLELRTDDGLELRYPVRLVRGERLTIPLAVPARSAVPIGFVFIAAGRFLIGSDQEDAIRRDLMFAPPLHTFNTGAYLIARTEVTIGDWLEFLEALPTPELERRRPVTPGGSVMLIRLEGGGGAPYSIMLQPTSQPYRARAGEPIVYPERTRRQRVAWERLPVSGISFDDAIAYTTWLAATGRVPRARLCTQPEWERAARGADERMFPEGYAIEEDDANIDETYGRKPLAFGPDEVGAHAGSTSPFGLVDIAGNALEWVSGLDDAPVMRGGSWYHGTSMALIVNREFGERTMRDLRLGFRVCADVAER